MPVTIVKCSIPGCDAAAEAKVAAPWKDGAFAELKTYGYTCPEHSQSVIAYAEKRFKPPKFPPGESLGAITTYELATV